MGMDPATAMLLAAGITGGSSAISNIFAPNQQLSSFEGSGVDPTHVLTDVMSKLQGAYGSISNPPAAVLRSSYVQNPPSFTGGGLPMPIGVAAKDPATTFMSQNHVGPESTPHLTTDQQFPRGGRSVFDNANYTDPGSDTGGITLPGPPSSTRSLGTPNANPNDPMIRRRNTSGMGMDLLARPQAQGQGAPDDLTQAMGAADLLRMVLGG